MYKKQTNPVAFRSQNMISDALLALMKQYPYHQISITQLCEKAGVGRKTFYRNFEDKHDIIHFQLDQLYQKYVQDNQHISLEEKVYYYFSFMKQHWEYLFLLDSNGLLPMLHAKFSSLTSQIMPTWSMDPVEQQYRSSYIVAGMEAILYVWARRGFAESVDEVVGIAMRSHDKQIPLSVPYSK